MSAAPNATVEPPAVAEPEELTAAWLSAALSRPDRPVTVDAVEATPLGTGQMARCLRLTLDGDGVPDRLVAKLPTADVGTRELVTGVYRGEVRFYTDLMPGLAVRAPVCHYGAIDQGGAVFTLLLEDVADARPGDQLTGCAPDEARAAAVNLAGLHGPRWCDPALSDDLDGMQPGDPDEAAMLAELYVDAADTYLERIGHLLDDEDRATLRDTVPALDAWARMHPERFTLLHGDYRLDNLLFVRSDDGVEAATVDWQTLTLGLPARDLAFLLGTGLHPEHRREHERDIVGAYHDALQRHGARDHPLEECWRDYRLAMLQGPLISVFGFAYGERTDRGDAMFTAMVQRSCAAIRELDSLALID